ncbi:MAG: alpha/beta hydrolase, partial [Alphaproteobacteria bacterium]|nr:alpha/beta hydrolase [Alphaproteobacteria bacterium]
MLSDRMRDRMADRRRDGAAALPASQTVAYGTAPEQAVDVYGAGAGAKKPLVLFIHGGGWSLGDRKQSVGAKADHFTGTGYVFASTGYRLVPAATVEEQAADVAAAIAALRRDAARLGVDPDRIALVGHSAGAHLA